MTKAKLHKTQKDGSKSKPFLKDSKEVAVELADDDLEQSIPVLKSTESLAKTDPLARYMQEVSRYTILTPEEEQKIARHYQKYQDKASAQKLILSNLRLVVKIAMEYRSAFSNLLDLIQEGNMGLMRAVEKYDVDRNVRFTSYAAWWVRAYILKFIIDNYRLVKIGTTQAQKKLFFNLMKEKERIEKQGFVPTAKLISERLNVKESEVQQMQIRMGSREFELDAPKSYSDSQATNLDFLSDGNSGSVEDALEQNELQSILLKNLDEFTNKLIDKEKKIFTERLFSEVPKTLQDIADEYGITRERIRQIEARLIKKMQKYFEEKGLKVNVQAHESDES